MGDQLPTKCPIELKDNWSIVLQLFASFGIRWHEISLKLEIE